MTAGSFTITEADRVLDKLGAEITTNRIVVGVVPLGDTFRLRLNRPVAATALPWFTKQKWRQTLRLTASEFNELGACTLDGDEALARTRERADL
jgi:hypothetical protein